MEVAFCVDKFRECFQVGIIGGVVPVLRFVHYGYVYFYTVLKRNYAFEFLRKNAKIALNIN